jgi:predicted AlkP superfamily phosphohydrolase/phosphomutase
MMRKIWSGSDLRVWDTSTTEAHWSGGLTTEAAGPFEKVLVVGWDGANLDLVRQWAAEGKLPAAARFLEEGSWGYLESTIPPISAPAWSSFSTGLNPGGHGIYYFREHVEGTYDFRLVKGADRRGKPLWRLLNEQGKRAGVVNVVMTWPPEELDGFMLSGMDTPDQQSRFAYPPQLANELQKAVGKYLIELPLEEEARNERYDALWAKIEVEMEARISAVRYLLREKQWDFFVVNFRATDSVQHHFWKFMDPGHPLHEVGPAKQWGDAIERVYHRLDQFLEELLAQSDEDTLIILMSDHGFGPVGNIALYLNNWLEAEGFLVRPTGGADEAGLAGRLKKMLWGRLWGRLRQSMPQAAKDLVERTFPRYYQRLRYPEAHFFIDWSRTRAYGDEYQESIWINLRGREPNGIVEPGEEYDALCREIVSRLNELRDPDSGEGIVETVYRRDDVYQGPEVGRAPDIVLSLRQDPNVAVRRSHTASGGEAVRTLSPEEMRRESLPSGSHRKHGMLLIKGAGVRQGFRLTTRHITDIAPTTLAALGCQVPDGLDGKIIDEAFEAPLMARFFTDERAEGPDGQAVEYDEAEADQMEQKLRGLGYL